MGYKMKTTLTELLSLSAPIDIVIEGMVLDSREVKEGDLFIALIGHQQDGRQFIHNAIQRGAAAVLAQTLEVQQHLSVEWHGSVAIISYYQLDQHVSALSAKFYGNPSHTLKVIGVTGTNGKTTIAQLIAQWCQRLGYASAVMGTIGNGLYGQLQEAQNTTGSALAVQQCLASFRQQSAVMAAMEVSSHGLSQYRVEAVQFSAAVFTNLSRDHLDYHQTMAAYAQAKFRLFSELSSRQKIINIDDPIGYQWAEQLNDVIVVSTHSHYQFPQHRYVYATQIAFNSKGCEIHFASSWGNGCLLSPLLGEFNVNNLLLVVATMLSQGFDIQQLCQSVSQLTGVAGRMEVFSVPQSVQSKATVIVDYAHTPDALEKALLAAKHHCQQQLWCVFGCGGDRDKGKRPLMGAIAEKYADKVIITDDNPRTENSTQILNDILQGISHPEQINVIADRKQAITYAIEQANAADIILVAGKGHEDYQIIGNVKHHFSDREIVQQLLTGEVA